jgi:FKBP-type peptidyl-prolyl cis-trans isomerase
LGDLNYILMLKKILAMALVATFTALAAQGQGVEVKKFRQGQGPKIALGNMVSLHFKQYLLKDTLVLNQRQSPGPVPLLISEPAGDPIMTALLDSGNEGDSMSVIFSVLKLAQEGRPLPPGLDSSMVMRFDLGIVKVQTKEEYQAEIQKANEGKRAQEEAAIVKYAAENGLVVQKTASGLHYAILQQGAGAKAQAGEQIEVHYTGLLLDGTKFDSSVDRGDTFKFNVGTGRVIPGWDEGFLLLNEGTKAVLLIPSYLAYGERNMGTIKAHSILRFDVAFIKVIK